MVPSSPLERVGTDEGECARGGGPCSAPDILAAVVAFAGGGAPPAAVRTAAARVGCATEACVLKSAEFRRFAAARGAGAARLDAELARNFKPPGPRSGNALLSNFNIDAVLQMWAREEFPRFYNFPFSMVDFASTGGALARTPLRAVLEGRAPQSLGAGGVVRRPCDTFACVLNTDYSSGRGKHWVALFGDCRGEESSIEYFNSAGNPPPREVVRWMEGAAAELRALGRRAEARAVTSVRHQQSQTECGNYALFYIRRRLEGGAPDEFCGHPVPDDAMEAFRRHIFRAPEK
jgi:hypothetical protein